MSAIGIDYGAVRIGVARELDGTGIVVPLATVTPEDFELNFIDWLTEFKVSEVYVGLPTSLSGATGSQAQQVQQWAAVLAKKYSNLSWYWIDERLTSVMAERMLSNIGKSSREQRKIVDAQAAIFILEQAIALRDGQGGSNATPIDKT